MRVRLLEILLLSAAAATTPAGACGPDFPNRLLVEGILELPEPGFHREISRWIGAAESPIRAVAPQDDYPDETEEADLRELAEVLGAPPPEDYVRARRSRDGSATFVSGGVPEEFSLYLRGAIAFRGGRSEEARAEWQRLLALPEPRRRHRSVWAAFMLGKSWLKEDPPAAIVHFRLARDLAGGGLSDRIGLAAASIGWEAQANLRLRRWGEAVALYLEHARTGDRTAEDSLRRVARMALHEEPEELARIARDPCARRLVTIHVLCRGGAGTWLSALEAAGVREAEEADRLAFAAYRSGEFGAAARWAAVAPAEAPLALWVRAKLALRGGRRDEALELLGAAARGFPDEREWRELVVAERGVVELERGRFVEALRLLREGGHWLDAAYVAERVVTIGELREFLRERPDEELSWLLGRRLARLRRFDEARDFLPEALRPELDALGRAISEASNPDLDARARSDALWRAARITRYSGMDLVGSELEPDWRAFGGDYTHVELSKSRAAAGPERDRLLAHGILPDLRWHYRYLAAELAWEAAALSPDGSSETARRLCVAGGWLKARDPKAADRFFKALVLRCGSTDLGREAARRGWFPKVDDPD